MDAAEESPTFGHVTSEMREAVRQKIIVAGLRQSRDIATALDLPHGVILRMLARFVVVDALRLSPIADDPFGVTVQGDSLSARFQNLTIPLW